MSYKIANHPLQLAHELYKDLEQVHGLKCRLTTGYGDQSASIHLPIFLEFSSFIKDILKNTLLIDEEVVIMIPDACQDTVENIVELIYTGVCKCFTVADRDIYTGKEIETFPAHKSEVKKLFPQSNIHLIIVYPIRLSQVLVLGRLFNEGNNFQSIWERFL